MVGLSCRIGFVIRFCVLKNVSMQVGPCTASYIYRPDTSYYDVIIVVIQALSARARGSID